MKFTYFDYAAATPVDEAVVEAMRPYWQDQFYNPSAANQASRAVRREIDEARHKIAQLIGARPAEVIFTSGATEANNLAISGVRQLFPEARVLVSSLEHDSVRKPAGQAGAEFIPADNQGVVDIGWLKNNLTDQTVLISLIFVSNETGVIQPISQVARLIAEERRRRLKAGNKLPLYLHTDAAQAANFFDLSVSRLGVDLMSVNGGKIYGPKQTGFLYVRAGTKLQAQITGGGQEFGIRAGTENVAGIIGLAKAFELAQIDRAAEADRLLGLRRELEKQLLKLGPNTIINGAKNGRAPHIISVTFEGRDNERLMFELDELGIIVATGSACSADKNEASPVLAAMGISRRQAQSTIRISLGKQISDTEIKKLITAIEQIIKRES